MKNLGTLMLLSYKLDSLKQLFDKLMGGKSSDGSALSDLLAL
ncbi:hypothetical protein I3760_01G223100 [Carya illinoinensis]|nr:hypothetical protein I3760_01G223100 [Carya illinoinensis]